MKRTMGVVICAVIMLTAAFFVSLGVKQVPQTAMAALHPGVNVKYSDSNGRGVDITYDDLLSATEGYYVDIYDNYGAIYKTSGGFVIVIPSQTLGVSLFKIEAKYPGGDVKTLVMESFSDDEEDTPIEMYTLDYTELGKYIVTVFLNEGSTTYEHTFFIVCKSGIPTFSPYFQNNSSYFQMKRDETFRGTVTLEIKQMGNTYYKDPDNPPEIFLSGVSIKNSNTSVSDLFTEGRVINNMFITFIIPEDYELAVGEYKISCTVTYEFTNINTLTGAIGTSTNRTASVSATLIIASKPTTSYLGLILGILAVAALGGAFIGCSYAIKYAEQHHNVKMERAMEQRHALDEENLARMRAEAKDAEQEIEHKNTKPRKPKAQKPTVTEQPKAVEVKPDTTKPALEPKTKTLASESVTKERKKRISKKA